MRFKLSSNFFQIRINSKINKMDSDNITQSNNLNSIDSSEWEKKLIQQKC